MRKKSAVLFIRCSLDEAQAIQNAARRERRTISGFVLNALANRISTLQKLDRDYAKQVARDMLQNQTRRSTPRTPLG